MTGRARGKALINQINDGGGINGRKIDADSSRSTRPVPSTAQAACVKFTQDDKVFLVAGFFVADAVNCVVDTHTAPRWSAARRRRQRLQNAKAPWLTPLPGADQPTRVIQALKANGSLDGKVGVFVGQSEDTATLNNDIVPALKEAGVTPVDDRGDGRAGERHRGDPEQGQPHRREVQGRRASTPSCSAASPAQNWPQYMETNPYRPKLLFLDITGARSFVTNKSTTDTSLLKDSLAGGPYGPDQAIFEEPQMQACIKTLTAAGVKTPAPEHVVE